MLFSFSTAGEGDGLVLSLWLSDLPPLLNIRNTPNNTIRMIPKAVQYLPFITLKLLKASIFFLSSKFTLAGRIFQVLGSMYFASVHLFWAKKPRLSSRGWNEFWAKIRKPRLLGRGNLLELDSGVASLPRMTVGLRFSPSSSRKFVGKFVDKFHTLFVCNYQL